MGQRVVSPMLRRTTIIAATSCRTQSCDMTWAAAMLHIVFTPRRRGVGH